MMSTPPPPKAFPACLEHYFSLLLSSRTVSSSVHANRIVEVVILVLGLLL